jgi:lipid-A-disaccharide synthase
VKLYIIAGEASGDLHGAGLISEMRKINNDAVYRAWGGDLMKKEGADIVKHYKDLAFMGFTEVVLNLRTILSNIASCKKDIADYKPDAVILIDYPGFNLRIAEFVHDLSIPVYYYISPQVWAWKSSRIKKIRKVVNKMFVILPFEKEFYKKFDYEVHYVGHPLPDIIRERKKNFPLRSDFLKKHSLIDKQIISLLPGSRKQEIEVMLPVMLSVINEFPAYQFVIAGAPSQDKSFYEKFIKNHPVKIIMEETYELLDHSFAALVTSGTATLETALMNVPEVVCYKGGNISYAIARALVKIKYISLVNLIMDKEVVKELIQHNLNTNSLIAELNKLTDDHYRNKVLEDYKLLNEKLAVGGASEKTAMMILQDLQNKI